MLLKIKTNIFLWKKQSQSVLSVTGKVTKREKGTENLELSTGKIEINIQSVKNFI